MEALWRTVSNWDLVIYRSKTKRGSMTYAVIVDGLSFWDGRWVKTVSDFALVENPVNKEAEMQNDLQMSYKAKKKKSTAKKTTKYNVWALIDTWWGWYNDIIYVGKHDGEHHYLVLNNGEIYTICSFKSKKPAISVSLANNEYVFNGSKYWADAIKKAYKAYGVDKYLTINFEENE